MLTAARWGEVRGAEWTEIDTSDGVWTIPATRMKAQRAHRVPLSRRAAEILEAARTLGDGSGPLVFPNRTGTPLPEKKLRRMLQDLSIAAVPHGFRSTFRDWAAERTNHPREVVEAALAHMVQNKVEAAYARSDLFERRRRLMDEWAAYVEWRTLRDCRGRKLERNGKPERNEISQGRGALARSCPIERLRAQRGQGWPLL